MEQIDYPAIRQPLERGIAERQADTCMGSDDTGKAHFFHRISGRFFAP